MLSITDLVMDYGDPLAEARRCRQHCALFDFSFVYRARLSGSRVIELIEAFQPRLVSDMSAGQVRYSVKTDVAGRVRSDLTLWRFGEHCFEIMSGCAADIRELQGMEAEGFRVEDLSEDTAMLSVQGPAALACLAPLMDVSKLRELAYFRFAQFELQGIAMLVGRLGYSGEAGFEFLVERAQKRRMWRLLSRFIEPAGFVAIDILRIEAGFFLFTNECLASPTVGELELPAGLGAADNPGERRLVAFTATARAGLDLAPWRPTRAFEQQAAAGEIQVTSACYSPHFDSVLGLGFVRRADGDESPADPGGEFLNIALCSLPPWDPGKNRPRKPW